MPDGMRTKGSIGTLDADCDATTAAGCTGYGPNGVFRSVLDEYFPGNSGLGFPWWGFVYHAGNNGSWVNSGDGNSGDITGE